MRTCFQNTQSCSWLVVRSNQSGPKNPNQVHRHQKPTCRYLNHREFHTWRMGIICWPCLILAILVLQFALKQWRKDFNKIQEKNESQQISDQWWGLIARVPSNVSSSTSVSPVKRSCGNQNPWSTIAEKEEGSVRPDIGSDRKTAFGLLLSWSIYGKLFFSKLLKVWW